MNCLKPAHSQARLLRDLKNHVKSVNPGSEPFASGLKSIESTAWALLLLRDIEWTALGSKTEYQFRVHTYVATSEGTQLSHSTPERRPKKIELSAHQRSVQRMASKTVAQYARNAEWVSERFEDALESPDLNGRTRLRCLTGRAAFELLVKSRFKEIESFMAGGHTPTGKLADFVARHGQVHAYRDTLYATEREAKIAMREDSLALPADHDLIVDYYERAFTQAGGFDEGIFDELVTYLRSQDHREAVQSALTDGADKGKLNRHDQIVLLVATAERRLASLSDPLPPSLHTLLGVSKNFLVTVMAGNERTKESVRDRLRQKMYELCPSKRPRKRKAEEVTVAPETTALPPSMDDNHRPAVGVSDMEASHEDRNRAPEVAPALPGGSTTRPWRSA
jgi:hypothetical protein